MFYCLGKGMHNANDEKTKENSCRAGNKSLLKDGNRCLAGALYSFNDLWRRVSGGNTGKNRASIREGGSSVLPDGHQCYCDAHLRDQDAGRLRSKCKRSATEYSMQSEFSLQPECQWGLKQAFQSWFEWQADPSIQLGEGGRERSRGYHSFNRFLKRSIAISGVAASLLVAQFAITAPTQAAASLIVRPTRIVMNEGTPVVAVTIQNAGTTETSIQLEIMAWAQVDGEDVYTDDGTASLLACPSVFTIPAGEKQIIRIAIDEEERVRDREDTFRLFIREIPPAPVDGQTAVQVALRIGVPIFLPPTRVAQPSIDWAIESRGEGGLWVTAHNRGIVHSLVQNVRLENGNDIVFEAATHRYVLPGVSMSWRLDTRERFTGTLPDTPLEFKATTDQGPYQEMLTVDR